MAQLPKSSQQIKTLPRQNTSGQGSTATIPPGIKGWNWGAFFLGWIWGIGNKVWISLFGFIPAVGFFMALILGAKGNEWAWQNKKWKSIAHFKKVQSNWAWAGVAVVIIVIIFYIWMANQTP